MEDILTSQKLRDWMDMIRPNVKPGSVQNTVYSELTGYIHEVEHMERMRDRLITEPGRVILNALQGAYKQIGDREQEFQHAIACMIASMCNVSVAWASISKGGLFQMYLYSEKDFETVKNHMGWACEKESSDETRYILKMHV